MQAGSWERAFPQYVRLYCYGCGAHICGRWWDAEFEEWTCCERPFLVTEEVKQRARKNWKKVARKWSLVWNALKCVRAVMLERAVECKFAPGGRGALLARAEFEGAVSVCGKRARETEQA